MYFSLYASTKLFRKQAVLIITFRETNHRIIIPYRILYFILRKSPQNFDIPKLSIFFQSIFILFAINKNTSHPPINLSNKFFQIALCIKSYLTNRYHMLAQNHIAFITTLDFISTLCINDKFCSA